MFVRRQRKIIRHQLQVLIPFWSLKTISATAGQPVLVPRVCAGPPCQGSGLALCFGHGTSTPDIHHGWTGVEWCWQGLPGLLCFCQEKEEQAPGNTPPLPGTQHAIRDALRSRHLPSDPRPALSPPQRTWRPASRSLYSDTTEISEQE